VVIQLNLSKVDDNHASEREVAGLMMNR